MQTQADVDLQSLAARALDRLQAQGFDQAQASATQTALTELNAANDRPDLLRSTHTLRLVLVGIRGGQRAAADLSEDSDAAIDAAVAVMREAASAAPVDEAHAVCAQQHGRIEHGPQAADTALLADTVSELLAFRAAEVPTVRLTSALAAHGVQRSCLLSSAGSEVHVAVGSHKLEAVFNVRDGAQSSSFNYNGGFTHDLAALPAPDHFAIGELMRDVARSVHARPLSTICAPFTGPVLLTPAAAASLLEWLLGQVADERLLSGTSIYRHRVGEAIASPQLTLENRFDAPGMVALSADGHLAPPLKLVDRGVLRTLTPNRYTSRKTGLAHVPVAEAGWAVPAGATPWRDLAAAIPRGALVARLSMGRPAANGDFAGVVKNSFLIEQGQIGPALAETMISGNVAQMLQAIDATSSERVDTGAWLLPWMRVDGLRFS